MMCGRESDSSFWSDVVEFFGGVSQGVLAIGLRGGLDLISGVIQESCS